MRSFRPERPLARPRTQGRAGGERAGAHAEARAERRRNVAEGIAATGAAAVAAEGSSDIGAEPVTTGFALRIDALHREAGQVLHFLSLRGRKAQAGSAATASRWQLKKVLSSPCRPKPFMETHQEKPFAKRCSGQANVMAGLCRERPVVSREKATRYCGKVARVVTAGQGQAGDLWKLSTRLKQQAGADRRGNREDASCASRIESGAARSLGG